MWGIGSFKIHHVMSSILNLPSFVFFFLATKLTQLVLAGWDVYVNLPYAPGRSGSQGVRQYYLHGVWAALWPGTDTNFLPGWTSALITLGHVHVLLWCPEASIQRWPHLITLTDILSGDVFYIQSLKITWTWKNPAENHVMWVKQCHKPTMTGNGKFIPPINSWWFSWVLPINMALGITHIISYIH